MIRYGVLLLGGLSLALPAASQTLVESLTRTYQTSPQLQSERARQRSTDEDVARARGGWRPTVQLQAETGIAREELSNKNAAGRRVSNTQKRQPNQLVGQIRQSIYDGGRTFADVDRAEQLVLRGRALLSSVEQQVLLDAVTAHLDLWRDQQILGLTATNVASLRTQVEAADARFRVRDVTRADVAQSQARLARGIADRQQAEGNLAGARSAYTRVVGTPAGNAVERSAVPGRLPTSLTEAIAALDANPDLNAARFTEAAAQADIDLASSGLRPDISFRITGRRLDETDTENFRRTGADASIIASIPLYEGGVTAARVRGAKQIAGQRRLEVETQRRRVIDQISRTWEVLSTTRARIVSLSEQVAAARVALDSVSEEVRVGTRTVLDQLDSEQELLDGQVALVRAQHDEVVAAHQLLSAMGGLTAPDLNLPVDIYDPTLYYRETRGRWIGTGID